MIKDVNNIELLRSKYSAGLDWVVGDTHGEFRTLYELMEKICFDPNKDRVFFVGDYNSGGSPKDLLNYISIYYQSDISKAGFHLIRGNHEHELSPQYPLENMPDIIVLRKNSLNYYIVHAGMVTAAFDLINADMAKESQKKEFAYRADKSCVIYDAPLRQIIWSQKGLYSQRSRRKNWPDEYSLHKNKACIIHGHTPYCFFNKKIRLLRFFAHLKQSTYGDKNHFFEDHHIWFSEDLQSFNIDSNIKGRYELGECYRGLTAICLNVIDEIASNENNHLSIEAVKNADNFVFTADYVRNCEPILCGDISKITVAHPQMKTISIDSDGVLFIKPESAKFTTINMTK